MKILILNGYVRENGGDAAIMSVHIRQFLETYPAAEILIASLEDPIERPSYETASNIGSIRRYAGQEDIYKAARVSRKLLSFLVALLCFRRPARRFFLSKIIPTELKAELQAIYEADIVVSVGGGHLNSVSGLGGDLNVFYLTLPVILAHRLGKLVVYGPQSFGPFGSKKQDKLVLKAVSKAVLIMVREEISYKVLTDLGVNPDKMLLTADAGFDFKANHKTDVRKQYGFTKSSRVVAITMRAWFKGVKREKLEKSFARFIDYLHDKNYEVLLVPQVTTDYRTDDDRIAEARIASYCHYKRPVLVTEPADAHKLKSLYDDVDFVVGTRFHSVIFALTSTIPCMAIEYDHKTSGIMRGLGLEDWVISLNDITAEGLITMFERLEKHYWKYKKTLQEVVPPKMREAGKMVSLIKKALTVGLGQKPRNGQSRKTSQ